jgi:PE family
MSLVIAGPVLMTAAASDLAGIESALSAAHAAAPAQTTAVLAAGADEVSAAAFHDGFVRVPAARPGWSATPVTAAPAATLPPTAVPEGPAGTPC